MVNIDLKENNLHNIRFSKWDKGNIIDTLLLVLYIIRMYERNYFLIYTVKI